MRRAPLKTVALLVETSNDYARGLLRGVVSYIREHQPWSTYLAEHGRGDQPPDWLAGWKGDGILARIENRRIARAVVASGLPAVDLSAANLVPGIPWVETDDVAIARCAFDHLLERGIRQFAFIGDGRFNWSRWRASEFARLSAAAGCSCAMLEVSSAADSRSPTTHQRQDAASRAEWSSQIRRIAQWVARLPRPVGIMACFDLLGRQVLEACRSAGVAVPDQAAVVGVDDDDLLCELAHPPLSSVAPDTHRTGYEAASLLDRLMSGRSVAAQPTLIAPLGIAIRKSSDLLAVDDVDVSAAARFIREHATEGIAVSDVLQAVPVSRRVLEARFKRLIGRSPHEEIERVRLVRAQELLRQTDLPTALIAARTGFEHPEYLSVRFKKRFGMPPSEYRRRHSRR